MTVKILIAGDSWAGGEWSGGNPPKLLHGGLGDYFQQAGYEVNNIHSPGKGNRHNINLCTEFLHLHGPDPRVIFFVVSDPLRNYDLPCQGIKQDIVDCGGLFELQKYHLRKDLEQLNQLAQQYETVVNLIGGLTTIDIDLSDLQYLRCLVRSWPELLVGQDPAFSHIDWNCFGIWGKWQSIVAAQLTADNALDRKVIDQMTAMTNNDHVFEHELFQPDGAHPNRQGHKILFDFICRKLRL